MNRMSDVNREIHVSHYLADREQPRKDYPVWRTICDPSSKIETQFGMAGGMR